MGIISGKKDGVFARSKKINSVQTDQASTKEAIVDRCPAGSLGISERELKTYRALEPRILLDAAAVETVEMAMDNIAEKQADTYFQVNTVAPLPLESRGIETGGMFGDEQSDPIEENKSILGSSSTNPSAIVFIDPSVGDLDTLIGEIDPSFEIVILDQSQDGIEQIANYLSRYSDINAVHIISHGDAGLLQLGTGQLTLDSISGEHTDELDTIKASLSENADLLIYGCDFGAGDVGSKAIKALAQATGADIAASDDVTGSALLGGDWELERTSGKIEAFAIAPSAWMGALDLTITNVGVGGAGSTGASVNALAQQIFGSGVTIDAATYSGGAQQSGTFVIGAGTNFGSNILTFSDGAIFSTGTATSVSGPNNDSEFTVDAPGIDADSDIDALAANDTYDASFLEVTFTPDIPPGASAGDVARMTMEIVFGSDEYNEYVYGSVNDSLAVIVNGVNQAVVPNGLAIGIDTINDAGNFNPDFGSVGEDPNPEHTSGNFESANASLYINNETSAFNTQMDGFTITIPVTFDVIVGQQNAIKIGIADSGDESVDSWMFVKADSGQTVIVAENDNITTPTNVPVTMDVTANDYDLQGDTLTVTHILGQSVSAGDVVTLASGSTVTVEANGDLTIAGDGVNTSNDAFTYEISDGNGGSSTAFVNVEMTAQVANTAPVAVDDGPIAITGNVVQNIDAVDNDTDIDGQTLSITHIIDPTNPGIQLAITTGNPITLSSGTIVELLANGTLDVTTSALSSGNENFDYVVSDGALSDQGTVNLDRSQGSLITVTSPISGVEDNNIPLNITVDPALTDGGSQLDIISTEAGFRDASAGATPTNFTIPANATAIRITGLGGNNNGGNDNSEEDYQKTTIVVDLLNGTFGGQVFHSLGGNISLSDNYAFAGVALGAASNSGPGLTGDNSNGFNAITVSTSGNTLSIVETQGQIDQAYLVEFLTASDTSANFLGSTGDFQPTGDTSSTITPIAGSNFAIFNIQDGVGGLTGTQEDKGIARLYVDLDTGLVSGTVFAQTGRGDARSAGYSFTGYNIASGLPILNPGSGATIVGDQTADADLLPNYTVSLSGSDIVFERTAAVATDFSSLVSVEFYERLNVGSGAETLGTFSVSGDYNNHQSNVNTWDVPIAGSSQTGVITLAMNNFGSAGSNNNENTGTAQIFVDLANGTTSGSFLTMRSSTPDLVSWTDVPFGTRLIDHIGTITNHGAGATPGDFSDQMSAVLQFDLVTQPDGSQILRATAQSESTATNGFLDYNVVMQANWAGRLPIEISGTPSGGSFSAGSFNATTGNWEIDPADVATLEFIPSAHFSGNTISFNATYNGNAETIAIDVERVADAPSLTVVDQAGDEDTLIDISTAITTALVDTDGSETLTLVELNSIPVGHTISDGTNSFTATLGSQSLMLRLGTYQH